MKYQWLLTPLVAFSLIPLSMPAKAQNRPGPYQPGRGEPGNGGGRGSEVPSNPNGPRPLPPEYGGDSRQNPPRNDRPGRPVPEYPENPRNEPPRNQPPRGDRPGRPNEPPRHEPPRRDRPGRPAPGYPNPPRNEPPRYPGPPRSPERPPMPPGYPNPGGYYGEATIQFNYVTRRPGGEWLRVNFYNPIPVRYIQARIVRAGIQFHEAYAITASGAQVVLREFTRTGVYYAPQMMTSGNFNVFDRIVAIDLRAESMGADADLDITVISDEGTPSIYPSRY